MSLLEYIEKLRSKPVRERERIAIIITIIGFFIFVGIWFVSFKEMNKSTEQPVDQTSASLNDLKDDFQDNFQTEKDSIQDMMQELPSQALPAEEAGGTAATDGTNSASVPATDNSASAGNTPPAPDSNLQNPNNGLDNNSNNQNNQDKPSVPQLP